MDSWELHIRSDMKIRYNMNTQELDVHYSEQDKRRMWIFKKVKGMSPSEYREKW